MFWLTDRCHKERVINCQQAPLARRWCNTPKTSVYICMKHLTLIKVRTADPMWLLHNISVYKSRPRKIKNWDQFLKRLVSPCLSLSQTLAESPSGAWNPPSLLILPGLLRSDRGGLRVSSPSGEQKDACGLCKWCKLLEVLLVSRVNQATQPLFSTEFSYWAILILLLFISLINI